MAKERPILFSGPMVRAILKGRKTQTRRVVRLPFSRGWADAEGWHRYDPAGRWPTDLLPAWCPYGQPGDLLLVKEAAWMWCERRPNGTTKTGRPKWHYVPMREAPVHYCADHPEKPGTSIVSPDTGNHWGWRKKLGRFLPKWAVRTRLRVTDVRVERLHDITNYDAVREGVERDDFLGRGWLGYDGRRCEMARDSFASLWCSINGADSWAANPWVWVVSFKRVEQARAVANG